MGRELQKRPVQTLEGQGLGRRLRPLGHAGLVAEDLQGLEGHALAPAMEVPAKVPRHHQQPALGRGQHLPRRLPLGSAEERLLSEVLRLGGLVPRAAQALDQPGGVRAEVVPALGIDGERSALVHTPRRGSRPPRVASADGVVRPVDNRAAPRLPHPATRTASGQPAAPGARAPMRQIARPGTAARQEPAARALPRPSTRERAPARRRAPAREGVELRQRRDRVRSGGRRRAPPAPSGCPCGCG